MSNSYHILLFCFISHSGKIPHLFLTGYVVPQYAVEGFFGSLREELVLEQTDVSITIAVLGLIGMVLDPWYCIVSGHDIGMLK